MLLVVWPVVSVTIHGERLPVSKSPFDMMELVHEAAGAVVDETVDGERFGTTTTLKISESAFLLYGMDIGEYDRPRSHRQSFVSQNLSHDL